MAPYLGVRHLVCHSFCNVPRTAPVLATQTREINFSWILFLMEPCIFATDYKRMRKIPEIPLNSQSHLSHTAKSNINTEHARYKYTGTCTWLSCTSIKTETNRKTEMYSVHVPKFLNPLNIFSLELSDTQFRVSWSGRCASAVVEALTASALPVLTKLASFSLNQSTSYRSQEDWLAPVASSRCSQNRDVFECTGTSPVVVRTDENHNECTCTVFQSCQYNAQSLTKRVGHRSRFYALFVKMCIHVCQCEWFVTLYMYRYFVPGK